MIVVDTSAIIAVLQTESEAARVHDRLACEPAAIISAGNALELQIVIARTQRPVTWDDIAALFLAYRIAVRPFDETQLALAREAALRFGKGRHKAKLNYGDCFAYALAMSEGLALLCVGNDFAMTDVEIA